MTEPSHSAAAISQWHHTAIKDATARDLCLHSCGSGRIIALTSTGYFIVCDRDTPERVANHGIIHIHAATKAEKTTAYKYTGNNILIACSGGTDEHAWICVLESDGRVVCADTTKQYSVVYIPETVTTLRTESGTYAANLIVFHDTPTPEVVIICSNENSQYWCKFGSRTTSVLAPILSPIDVGPVIHAGSISVSVGPVLYTLSPIRNNVVVSTSESVHTTVCSLIPQLVGDWRRAYYFTFSTSLHAPNKPCIAVIADDAVIIYGINPDKSLFHGLTFRITNPADVVYLPGRGLMILTMMGELVRATITPPVIIQTVGMMPAVLLIPYNNYSVGTVMRYIPCLDRFMCHAMNTLQTYLFPRTDGKEIDSSSLDVDERPDHLDKKCK